MISAIRSRFLVSVKGSGALDAEARSEWAFSTFALIEAAGRSCAQVVTKTFPGYFRKRTSGLAGSEGCFTEKPRVTAAIGAGNNGADAMVMLRYWILAGLLDISSSALVVTRMPKRGETGAWVDMLKSLKKIKVPILVWDADVGEVAGRASDDILAQADIIIDGIAGTGISGPLQGAAGEMVNSINAHRKKAEVSPCHIQNPECQIPNSPSVKRPLIISVDLPSGNSDEWKPGMPMVEADVTLAIEPQKYCIYNPAARPYAGIILPVGGIFPGELIARYAEAEILDWKTVRGRISGIRPTAYKHQRGTVEVRAGSPGATGAALIAARGAQAAGAGLVRLLVDDDIYPILATQSTGIMIAPAGDISKDSFGCDSRFKPDAILLGPGWGRKTNRAQILENALILEQKGIPLVLDADAIELAKEKIFSGNVILTPHPGEFSKFSGVEREELLSRPLPILLQYARERKAVILFKGHVITIAAPDGRVGIVDGMTPVLATGGSGDLLAGFCAAIAARMAREERGYDAYTCAAAAAALLIASGKSAGFKTRFTDPLELACRAADLAGEAWLNLDI